MSGGILTRFGGDKAPGLQGSRAEGKKQGCKEEGYYGYLGGHDMISFPPTQQPIGRHIAFPLNFD
ncbi:MAG: hypothetical protein RLN82_04390, partial [Pseudomonadales bacterium]